MTIAGKMLLGVVVVSAFGLLAFVVGGSGFGRWGSWSYYLFCAGVILLIAGGIGTVVTLVTAIIEATVKRTLADEARTRAALITLLLAVLAVAVAGVGVYVGMQL